MQILHSLDEMPFKMQHCILTIGSFDGIHLGHLEVLKTMTQLALQYRCPSVILTFTQHPRKVLNEGDINYKLINTNAEKIFLLQKQSIDFCIFCNFTPQLAQMSANDFITQVIVQYFNPKIIIIGYDHKFGKNRTGDITTLKTYEQQFNYRVKEIPQYVVEHNKISSTQIRRFLIEGHIKKANQLLGYTYFLEGIVMAGKQLGRTIGFPTANIKVSSADKLIPKIGVYAVAIQIENNPTMFKAMLNIGMRPTVSNEHLISIEAHILNFNENIYEKKISVFFYDRIRDEIKFPTLESLTQQLIKDKHQIENYNQI